MAIAACQRAADQGADGKTAKQSQIAPAEAVSVVLCPEQSSASPEIIAEPPLPTETSCETVAEQPAALVAVTV